LPVAITSHRDRQPGARRGVFRSTP